MGSFRDSARGSDPVPSSRFVVGTVKSRIGPHPGAATFGATIAHAFSLRCDAHRGLSLFSESELVARYQGGEHGQQVQDRAPISRPVISTGMPSFQASSLAPVAWHPKCTTDRTFTTETFGQRQRYVTCTDSLLGALIALRGLAARKSPQTSSSRSTHLNHYDLVEVERKTRASRQIRAPSIRGFTTQHATRRGNDDA